MYGLNYIKPKTLDECLELLSRNKGDMKVVAGGTDILPRIRAGKEQAGTILDISQLGLNYINEKDGNITIGATTDLTSIIEYFENKDQPVKVLGEAARQVGSWQTRNLATIGGNICTGNSSADLAPALLVLDAELTIIGNKQTRTVPIDHFFISPRSVDTRQNELLAEINIKKPIANGYGTHFSKIGKRKGHFIAIMNIAVAMITSDDMVAEHVKVAVGTLAPTPIRLYKTEEFLTGRRLSEKVIEDAQNIMMTEIKPRTSLRSTKEYRRSIAPVLLKRAILASAGHKGDLQK